MWRPKLVSVVAGPCLLLLVLGHGGEAPEAAPAPHAPRSYVETIPGTKIKFEMIALPGGSFVMGSPDTEAGRKNDEGPRHPVRLGAFWMGKCEVTWDEYDSFWRSRPGHKKDVEPEFPRDADAITRPTPPYCDETWQKGREGKPVLGITWHAAMQYCRWLSMKTGKTYRLPTEAEWEFACRAGTTTAYSFGDDRRKLGDYAWFSDNSDEKTYKVGSKKPNAWGLYDMHGNVSEWCLDRYRANAYAGSPRDHAALSPVVLPDESRYPHVVRGGSWADEARDCRSAARVASDRSWQNQDPDRPMSLWWMTDADFVGFRLVRAVREQGNLKGVRSQITPDSPVK